MGLLGERRNSTVCNTAFFLFNVVYDELSYLDETLGFLLEFENPFNFS